MTGEYQKAYDESIGNPKKFWAEAAKEIQWYTPPSVILDDSRAPMYRWFSDGMLNVCYNALDYHVETGRADQTALVYDSAVTETIARFTYKELLDRVSRFAGVLAAHGVRKGDTVVIYMPMVPEAAVAMLACARIGAIHSVVFGGFASNELAIRIDDAKPRLVVSASCGIEVKKVIEYKPLLDKAIELAGHKPETCIIYQRPQATADMVDGRDVDWVESMGNAEPVECTPVKATDPLYILYTSGTTGIPKGVVMDSGGYSVALKWSMKNIFGVDPGDTFWAASDVGWAVGHSYTVYGPLIHGCTTVLYEGKPVGTPDAGSFWRVISEHKAKVLFTAPTAFRAIKREDPDGKCLGEHDLAEFKCLFLAGERTDPDTYRWAHDLLDVPVIDHWWQTETGWPVAANCIGIELLPVKPGSVARAVPGYKVRVLDSDGNIVPPGIQGTVVIELPLPPGTLPTLWHNDRKFRESYLDPFPGYYFTGDEGYIDDDSYIYIMGRLDDVINVAGHRLSTGAMEEVIAQHPDVAECAVVGAADEFKGQLPLGFVVLKAGRDRDHDEIARELIQMVRNKIGPIACFKQALVVNRLPKTRSGKVLRKTMRKIADGDRYNIPSTIDDATILTDIAADLQTAGYGRKNQFPLPPCPA